MKIFKLKCNWDDFAMPSIKSKEDRRSFYTMDNFQQINNIIELNVISDGESLDLADISNFGTDIPICISSNSYLLLRDIIKELGVIKEASIDKKKEPYYIFWPSNVLDCLDEKQSKILTTPSGYRRLERAVFDKSKISKMSIFTIPQFVRESLYITEDIAQILNDSVLTGYILEEI